MIPAGCETDILRRLAELPFLDRLELAAVSGRSRGAVYEAISKLTAWGMVDAIPHATPLIPPVRRYCLTADGLRGLASTQAMSLDELLSSRPVSARWRRVLLERLDALAVIYRVAAALSNTAHPIRFRWYRSGPADAGIFLPDGRCIAVVRQGNTADRATFAKRLWRLSEEARPGAVLLLVPDDVRLRQASRALDSLPLLGFLACEGDAARGDAGAQVWRTPSAPVPLSLREVLDYVRPGGELPGQTPPRRDSLPADLDLDSAGNVVPTCLLPTLLKPVEKRALDLLSDWPWLQPAHLGQLMGVGRTRLYQVLERLREVGLVIATSAEGHRCLTLSDKGLAVLARRDRTAVGLARRRWSAAPVKPEVPLTWRNVHGSRSRQLLRNLEHTQAVHWFLAVLANQSRNQGWKVAQFDPPRRASRFFSHHDRLHSVRPDAFGVLRARGEGDALLPGVGAAGGAAGYDGGPHRALPALLRRQPAPGRPRRCPRRPGGLRRRPGRRPLPAGSVRRDEAGRGEGAPVGIPPERPGAVRPAGRRRGRRRAGGNRPVPSRQRRQQKRGGRHEEL